MKFKLSLLTAALALGSSAFAQTKWDLPAAYPASNFHTENLTQFAADVDKLSAGKLKIAVHANASLFKALSQASRSSRHASGDRCSDTRVSMFASRM